MKLTIAERFGLLGILPIKGNILTMKLVQGLSDLFGFDDAEQAECGLKQEDDRWTWKPETPAKDIEIGDVSRQVIVDALKGLSEQNALTLAQVPLYDKFVNAPKPPEE